jgi:predicted phosphodiesterase
MRKLYFFVLLILFNIDSNAGNPKIIHGPYLQNLTQNSVSILFHTESYVVPGILLYDENNNSKLIRNSDDGLLNIKKGLHKVKIDGLLPGKSYKYKIMSVELDKHEAYKIVFGDTLYSDMYEFKTFSNTDEDVEFVMFCDVHDRPDKIGSYVTNSVIKKPDFYLLNGDIIGHVDEEKQIYDHFIDTCVQLFASEIPMVYARGNHETRGPYARSLNKYFDSPTNEFYYAFSVNNIRFVVLDGGEDKPDTHHVLYGFTSFENYRDKQLLWLKEEVNSKEFKESEVQIVFVHMPIINFGESDYGMKQLNKNFGPVLQKAGIDLVMSGHTHSNYLLSEDETEWGYPLVICSNNDFVEVKVKDKKIDLLLKDRAGKKIEHRKYNTK